MSWGMGSDGHECIMGDGSGGCECHGGGKWWMSVMGVGSDGHECIMGDGNGGCECHGGWEVMDMSVPWDMSVMGDAKRWT